MWSLKTKKYSELKKQDGYSAIESIVLQLVEALLRGQLYIIYIDNLFIRIPLLLRLRQLNIRGCGIIRRHPEFLEFLL